MRFHVHHAIIWVELMVMFFRITDIWFSPRLTSVPLGTSEGLHEGCGCVDRWQHRSRFGSGFGCGLINVSPMVLWIRSIRWTTVAILSYHCGIRICRNLDWLSIRPLFYQQYDQWLLRHHKVAKIMADAMEKIEALICPLYYAFFLFLSFFRGL